MSDTVVFEDLMFDDGTSYAVYEAVGDGTTITIYVDGKVLTSGGSATLQITATDSGTPEKGHTEL